MQMQVQSDWKEIRTRAEVFIKERANNFSAKLFSRLIPEVPYQKLFNVLAFNLFLEIKLSKQSSNFSFVTR